jgi:hypothetical protein
MNSINVKGNIILLDTINPQISTKGEYFILSEIKINTEVNSVFSKKYNMFWSATYYIFRYINTGFYFGFYFDENDIFIKFLNNEELKDVF